MNNNTNDNLERIQKLIAEAQCTIQKLKASVMPGCRKQINLNKAFPGTINRS